jgi:hypothetical protein
MAMIPHFPNCRKVNGKGLRESAKKLPDNGVSVDAHPTDTPLSALTPANPKEPTGMPQMEYEIVIFYA